MEHSNKKNVVYFTEKSSQDPAQHRKANQDFNLNVMTNHPTYTEALRFATTGTLLPLDGVTAKERRDLISKLQEFNAIMIASCDQCTRARVTAGLDNQEYADYPQIQRMLLNGNDPRRTWLRIQDYATKHARTPQNKLVTREKLKNLKQKTDEGVFEFKARIDEVMQEAVATGVKDKYEDSDILEYLLGGLDEERSRLIERERVSGSDSKAYENLENATLKCHVLQSLSEREKEKNLKTGFSHQLGKQSFPLKSEQVQQVFLNKSEGHDFTSDESVQHQILLTKAEEVPDKRVKGRILEQPEYYCELCANDGSRRKKRFTHNEDTCRFKPEKPYEAKPSDEAKPWHPENGRNPTKSKRMRTSQEGHAAASAGNRDTEMKLEQLTAAVMKLTQEVGELTGKRRMS